MKRTTRIVLALLTVISLCISLALVSVAHSGRTDSSGGHNDNKNASGLGGYHYHCGGYPAHLHDGGYCPYKDVFPSSVSISADRTTLGIGESVDFAAAVYPSNSCNTSVTCETSDSSVVQIQNGKLKAIGYGTATITATSFNGRVGYLTITVKEITANSVAIENKTDHLYIGEEFDAKAVISPENVDNPKITWTSSDESVATVGTNGKVTAIASGYARITASASNGVSGSFDVLVEEKLVENISIQDNPTDIGLSESIALLAALTPSDATYQDVVWSSSDPTVLAVDESGNANAVGLGIATITATSSNGLVDTIDISVNEILAESISIIGDNSILLGDQMALSASLSPENTTNKEISWSCDNPEILFIDEDGVVTANWVGTATVTATHKDVETSIQITVLPIKVSSVKIDSEITDPIYIEDTLTFTATVSPDDATYSDVVWTSSDESIATIDADGNFTAISKGLVTITATADGVSDSIEIEVKKEMSGLVALAILLTPVVLVALLVISVIKRISRHKKK